MTDKASRRPDRTPPENAAPGRVPAGDKPRLEAERLKDLDVVRDRAGDVAGGGVTALCSQRT